MTEEWTWGARGRDGFTLPGAEPSYAPDLALEPVHITVRLAFDLEAQRAEGRVVQRVRARRADVRSLAFDAVDLDVEDVRGDGLRWRYDGQRLHVTWDDGFAAGEEREAEIVYAVERPVSGMRFHGPDERYPDRPLCVGTDHETERARYWLPCVDYPTVRTTFDFHLTAAEDLVILANGDLVDETAHGDGTKTAHWKLDYPCPSYLSCLAVGRFVRHDDEPVGGRPIAYFATDAFRAEDLARTFGRTPAMMRWLEEKLDQPFPFSKYFQIALPGIGGAMENISLVTWDDACLQDESLAPERAASIDSVNLHEMAHAYFGDAIVCRHFEHTWLKESWAVYMETLYWEDHDGRDAMDFDLHENAARYIGETARYVRPIVTRTYNSSWDLFDMHTYPGGAWRIHMLRRLVGDDAFLAAMRDYVRTFMGKVVETDDFRKKLEEHSGLNLVRFFDEWIHAPGFPKLKARWEHDAENDRATLTIEQTQVDKDKGVGTFTFDLPVAIDDEQGTAMHSLRVDGTRARLVVPVRGKVRRVRIDPAYHVLFALDFNPGADLLRGALREAPDVRSRIHAAQELIKTGTRANLRAVRDAMLEEPFWGVRAAVGAALGESRAAEAIEPLAALLLAEKEPRALRPLALACDGFRDPRLATALRTFLDRDPPPYARAAALAALGSQRAPDDRARLTAAADAPGMHGVVAAGALAGLGRHRTRKALGELEARLPYGSAREEVRATVTEAYGRCAHRLARADRLEAVDRLVDLTRDPTDRVRVTAAKSLAAMGARGAARALERLKTLQPRQDGPLLDRLLQRLRKSGGGDDTAKLREQVEKLEARLRKLVEKVQDLAADAEARK